jgi:uncharacterized protein YkwD
MRGFIRIMALIIGLLSAIFAAPAQTGTSAAEQELFGAANRARSAQGLSALKWSDSLASAARTHAAVMAQHGAAEHIFPGEPGMAARATRAGAHFISLSEDVAQGPTVVEIHDGFMKSPNHRANILDSNIDLIGIGVVARGGQLFAVEDFSKARP